MYNVLLVDDEPTIREGLRTLIDWEELGYRVVDTAVNGKDALVKCAALKPDLLIIDIRMPGMSGLDVIEQLRTTNHSLHILILSGYADFDYAKRAISYRTDGYLLKPVDEDELIGYLRRLRKTLELETEAQRAGGVGEWTREMVIQSLLTGGYRDMLIEAAERAGLRWQSYEVLLIKPQSRFSIEASAVANIKRQLIEQYDMQDRGAVFAMEPYLGVVTKGELGSETNRAAIMRDLRAAIGSESLDFVAACGGEAEEWTDVERSYQQAVRIMKHRFFLGNDRIHDKESTAALGPLPQEGAVDKKAELDDLPDKLYLAIDIASEEAIRDLSRQAGERMRAAGFGEEAIKSQAVQLLSTVISKFANNNPGLPNVAQEYSAVALEIYREYRYEELLERIAELLIELSVNAESTGTDKQIKKMIDLIQRNYHENLKLETLAEVFNYNSAYLGKLFKNATGEYFNTYLDKVRIEHAKALLDEGMKVYQVAEKVGYTNVDYFHSKFRKYVGTSPSAYRKK